MSQLNNCQNHREAIAALVLGELEPHAADRLKKHINACRACQRLYNALADEEKMIQAAFKSITDRAERIESKLIEQFDKQKHQSSSRGLAILRRPSGGLKIIKQITKIAAAAIIIIGICILGRFILRHDPSDRTDPFGGFSLLAQACAAEDKIFAGENIVHLKNEIIVYPILEDEDSSGQSDSADLSEQIKNDFDQLNKRPDFTWLPMCSLQANGQFMFNQLKLSIYIEPYTVIDQAWYEPATGCFARVLETDGKIVFANSYDGESIYTSQIAPDGTLQLVKEAVTRKFKPPQKPAAFLGMSAGLRSSLGEDTPMVQGVEEGTLQDGCLAHIYKVGTPGPYGELRAYWLFKVRDDDNTIAETEFIIADQSQLLIRRVLTESVQTSEISWNLAEIEGLPVITEAKPRVSITRNMVVTDVSVQHMVERASFETYIFTTKPPWTNSLEIIDCIDPASFGKRMFIFACRADDGRHLVLVQSPTYNKMLGKLAKSGHLVYTSPNDFKVWGGGPNKWYSNILLSSARASIKDPPSNDRIGYILESPAGTFPALAVNGPLTDEELHNLIDSLMLAKEYLE
ncbi:MAG: anti-sigma factor family protein [Planctomycetota bacterium]|jgi:hypothetical protein